MDTGPQTSSIVGFSQIGYAVGVLVQTNFGGVLTIAVAPVGQKLGQYYLRKGLLQASSGKGKEADGSCMIAIDSTPAIYA